MPFSNASGSQNCDLFFYLIVFPVRSRLNSDPPPAAAAAAKSLQSCLTLCDSIDGLLPCSSVPGIL